MEYFELLEVIERESVDGRNYVRKAVNWALREIGKRNDRLRKAAIRRARRIGKINDLNARWIAKDTIKELESEKVIRRFRA